MNSFLQTPEWLGAAMIGAIIAALGYVAKLIIETIQSYIEKKRINKSKLIELRSLLHASKVAFVVQNTHAKRLKSSIIEKNNHFSQLKGFEEIISSAYDLLDKDQKELHAFIRSITINTLAPINKAMLEWLRNDVFYKARNNELAYQLSLLGRCCD